MLNWSHTELQQWITNGCDPEIAKNVINLHISNNGITELPKEIGSLTLLQYFNCSHNQITELPKEIGLLTLLQQFNCSENEITELPLEIMNCTQLVDFKYNNNEIEYIPPQLTRFLNRGKSVQKIYNDAQSVHNHNIQEGIRNSIHYVMSKKPSIINLRELILNNMFLDETCKSLLFEYMDDASIHSVLNITFEELLLSVYDFILKNEHKDELFKILSNEIKDGICKCFTGRISRLINTLNGFDENIKINIADNEQIGNIIILIRNKLEQNNEYTDESFKLLIKKEEKSVSKTKIFSSRQDMMVLIVSIYSQYIYTYI